MESQCLGLAEALGHAPRIFRAELAAPWRHLLEISYGPLLAPLLARVIWRPALPWLSVAGGALRPPWPEILISCGRKSVPLAIAVRRAAAGATFAVHIQDPHVSPGHFDLVAAPRHDGISGENIIATRAAIHRVTPAKLSEAASRFAPAFAALPRPLVAVLIGGSNRRQRIDNTTIDMLAARLASISRSSGAGLLVTTSRRTGAEATQRLRQGLAGLPLHLWTGTEGENPYFAFLALADAIVVTGDSVSMVSEACATGKPVYVFDLEGAASPRLAAFHEWLRRDGVTRTLGDTLEHWTYAPLDDTGRVADEVRRRRAEAAPGKSSQTATPV